MSTLKSGLLNVLTRSGLDADLINKAAQIIDDYIPQDSSDEENPVLPNRYEDVGLVSRDSLIENRCVRDKALRRVIAMVIGPQLADSPQAKTHFIEKAQQMARLEHPSIVPVHDIGELENGRPFYTTKLHRGLPLKAAVVRVLQSKFADKPCEDTDSELTFRSLIECYRKVILATGYASSKAVYHGNLTVENILIGNYGEVLITNWVHAEPPAKTQFSPEENDITAVLGWILFYILSGTDPTESMRNLPREITAYLKNNVPSCPPQLVALCQQACVKELTDYRDLLAGIDDWLEGVQKKEKSTKLIAEAEQLSVLKSQLWPHIHQTKSAAESALLRMSYHAPEQDKYESWRKQEEAQKTLEMAEMLEQEQIKHLNGALGYDAENTKAHLALSKVYWERVQRRKNDGNVTQQIRDESRLLQAAQRLQKDHPDRKRIETYLKGPAKLTLHTSVPGAKVYRQRYENNGIILETTKERYLGLTPLDEIELTPGSYLLTIRKEGYEDVCYPVSVRKGEHWHGRAPGEEKTKPVWLPPTGTIPQGFCYVPAGWTVIGGDSNPDSRGKYRQRIWVDGFALAKFQVTNREYIAFLNDLVNQGREDEANRYAPHDMLRVTANQSNFYKDSNNRFHLAHPESSISMHPEHSVGNIDTACMAAYIDWMKDKTGLPYRFVRYDEWEKAARGVDERIYPWGNQCDPSIVNMNLSFEREKKIAPPEDFPLDVSPYGVRFMSGNCADLVDSVFDRKPPIKDGRFVYQQLDYSDPNAIHLLRGNGFFGNQSYCRTTNMYYYPNVFRLGPKGFRLCLDLKNK